MKQGLWVLGALALGVALGAWLRGADSALLTATGQTVGELGAFWLDALRMTLLPLIVSVLVAAVAGIAETAAGGTLARRALILFAALLIGGAVYAIAVTDVALNIWPIDPASGQALLKGAGAGEAEAAPAIALGPWLRSLIPTNVFASAAEGAVLPLVVFACIFGFALTRLPKERRAPVLEFFQSAGDAMIVVVRWVLWFAPLGVFALSVSLGMTTGFDALGVLAQYVAIVIAVTLGITLFGVLLAIFGARMPALDVLRALAPVQVIAASTQSSLATLPAMLETATQRLNVPLRTAEFVLPLAVAVFRMTSPVANLAATMFVVHLHGIEPTMAQMGAAVAVAFAVSVSSVGLPGQTSFFASVAPCCVAMGAPIEVLPLLLAVEVLPDIFRTIGNVTGDLAVTVLSNRPDRGNG